MERWKTHLFILLCLYPFTVVSQFHNFLGAYSAAYNSFFHDGLLKQLNAYRQSTTAASPTPTDISLSNLAIDTASNLLAVGTTNMTFAHSSTSTFQIYSPDMHPTNPPPSEACAAALSATISCNSTVPLMSTYPFLLINDLASVCTNACTASLADYRNKVVSTCGSYLIPGPNNASYSPVLALDTIAGPYGVQCLQDPTTKQFCHPLIASFNTSGGLLDLPQDDLCSFCTLKTLNMTISNPMTYSEPLASLFSMALAVCGPNFASYQVTSPPVQGAGLIINPPSFGANIPNSGDDCSLIGKDVTVPNNTTCTAVARQQNVTIDSILMTNPFLVGSNNCSITAGSQLCLMKPCITYTIQINDTCPSVATLAGLITGTNITTTQLKTFNPGLGSSCQLMPLKVGETVCISPNGGWPNVGAASSANIPSAAPTTFAPVPTPTVSGTTSDCGRYYQVRPGDICNTIVLNNSIQLGDFLNLNPEVNENCTNLWLNYYYCVAPFPPFSSTSASAPITTNFSIGTVTSLPFPTPTAPAVTTVFLEGAGIPAPTNLANGTRTAACGWYYNVVSGDTIESISDSVGVSEDDLFTWNPQLQSSNPIPGTAICMLFPLGNYTLFPASTPANVAANVLTDVCAEYYTVQPGDSCTTIEANLFISKSDFLALNPGLNAQCTNLIGGAAYCVLSIHPQANSTDSTSVPDNVASGTITQGCTKYYTIVTGDSCPAIESKFNISNSLFRTMNPEVNSDCSNILLGEAYCVQTNSSSGSPSNSTGSSSSPTGPPSNVAAGTITAGCTGYYTVISGDSCSSIEIKFGISDSLFKLMNPEINTACTNILIGEAYCIGTTNSTSTSDIPSNVASRTITAGCTKYYDVVSGDSCPAIETRFNITNSQFRAMNPEINSACSNIILGQAYCVQSHNTTTSNVPDNIASGTTTTCSQYYTVASGDTCGAIGAKFDITDAQFHTWNPEVNSACSNILLGEAYCVST